VRPGIEVLLSDSSALVRGRRVGLLTNHTGVDRVGRRDADLLIAAGVRVTALFSPEHGFRGREDRYGLPDAVDSATGLPIFSLYRGARPPNFAGLDSVDVVLIDLQDIGARYYTYVSTVAQMLREGAKRRLPVVVLDRPNPVGGVLVQGHVRDSAGDPTRDFIGFLPVPMRHGLTMGEMARMTNAVLDLGADLRVVPLAGWKREYYFDATGLPWLPPSPNMPDQESALHYPGTCMFEGTNLSVGRGTAAAYQRVGAPWLDPEQVLGWVRAHAPEALAGVSAAPDTFTPLRPTDEKYDGVTLRAVRLRVTDRARYDPTRLAVALLAALRAVHPGEFRFRDDHFDRLAAGPALRVALLGTDAPARIWTAWQRALDDFRDRRVKYLIY
jgi:uncharacterized protein YbbC (DUF1343 family)